MFVLLDCVVLNVKVTETDVLELQEYDDYNAEIVSVSTSSPLCPKKIYGVSLAVSLFIFILFLTFRMPRQTLCHRPGYLRTIPSVLPTSRHVSSLPCDHCSSH